MKIGILETGEVLPALAETHGDYPAMFKKLLRVHAPDAEFITIHVVNNAPLGPPTDADGWVITGSRHGIYDDLPWINPLKQFLRDCVAQHVPVAGICFGHQILAEALGGKAEKSDKGWGLGAQTYLVINAPSWMDNIGTEFTGHAVHQDQVTELPPTATPVASSDFCEYAALVYGNLDHPDAISVQPHPEFSAAFVDDLIDVRLKDIVPSDIQKNARQTLGQPVSNTQWGGWIVKFLEMARQ